MRSPAEADETGPIVLGAGETVGDLTAASAPVTAPPAAILHPSGRGGVYYGWVVLAGCTALSVLSGAFFYSRGLFLPELTHAFGVGRLQIALAFTFAQVSGALSAPLIGRALDRGSPRRILAASAVLLGTAYLAVAAARQLWLLYAAFGFMAGVGWVGISNFGSARILVEWFRRRIALVLAVDSLGASLAGVVIAPIVIALIAQWGWRGAYASLGVLTAGLALPIIALVLRSRPSDLGLEIDDGARDATAPARLEAPDAQPPDGDDAAWTTGGVLATPAFWGVAVIFGVMSCVWSGLNLHLFGHLKSMGLDARQAALVLSVEAAATALAKPGVGWLADRVGVRRAIVLSLAMQVVAVAAFAAGSGLAAALSCAALYGVGLSGLVTLQAAAVVRTFGRRSYGSAAGLLAPVILPFTLVSSPLAGYVYDVFGDYRRAFGCYAVLLLLAAPATRLLAEPRARRTTAFEGAAR